MVVALSGKCCSGKNYISDLFKERGWEIVDVDIVSHNIFNKSGSEIVKLFGSSIVRDGEIDRKRVGEVVFSDSGKLRELEKIIHPKVYKEIYRKIEGEGNYLINIPLLTDYDLVERCDYIVWIKSPLILRFFRALKRDHYSFITVFKRIYTQRKLSVKQFTNIVDIFYIRNGFNSKKVVFEFKKLLKKIN